MGSSLFLLYRTMVRLAPFSTPKLQITFFDVGQGDSALIDFPDRSRWMVDGGGAFLERQIGRELFAELTSQGILRLHSMVLTHPDADHGEGLLSLLSELTVDSFLYNPAITERAKVTKPLLTDLIARAHLRKAKALPITRPQSQRLGGARVSLLPLKGITTNDRALVLNLQFGECSVLLTGDIEKEGEKELVARSADWPAPTVLKVAHHGSRTSSTPRFLRKLSPRFAVVSSGVTNRYGHPNATVLERLRQFGAEVLRTDFHGWVRFTFTADSHFECQSSLGSCGEGRCLTDRQ